mgnify:CR=1 FL=1
MNSFTFQCATKIIFGKDTEYITGTELKSFGAKKVLMVYGGKSIKTTGLYQRVVEVVRQEGIELMELPGVVPNPRVSLVREGIKICRENSIDFLLAVGGGSVIDTAKAISFGVFYSGDVWDLISGKEKPGTEHLPIGTILTLPAAGSEASDSCVISDETIQVKTGFGSPLMRPAFSIMNPELTYTLPPYQTACGCMDIMAHTMERYFSQTDHVELTDRMSEGILKTIIHNLPIALKNPDDYNARAEIMWAGTLAQNDLVGTGRDQCWFNHGLEHQISGYYDIAHGAGLAITFPAWMTFVSGKPQCLKKLVQYAVRVWNIEENYDDPLETARQGIDCLRNFIHSCGLPVTLSEVEIGSEKFNEIASNMTDNGQHTAGGFYPLSKEDIIEVLELAK